MPTFTVSDDPLYTSAFAHLRTKGVAGEISANGATGVSAFNLRTVLDNVIADSRCGSANPFRYARLVAVLCRFA